MVAATVCNTSVAQKTLKMEISSPVDLNNNNVGEKTDDVYSVADITTASPTILTIPHTRAVSSQEQMNNFTKRAKDGSWILRSPLLTIAIQQLQIRLGKLNLSLRSIVHIIKKLLKSESWMLFVKVIYIFNYYDTLTLWYIFFRYLR